MSLELINLIRRVVRGAIGLKERCYQYRCWERKLFFTHSIVDPDGVAMAQYTFVGMKLSIATAKPTSLPKPEENISDKVRYVWDSTWSRWTSEIYYEEKWWTVGQLEEQARQLSMQYERMKGKGNRHSSTTEQLILSVFRKWKEIENLTQYKWQRIPHKDKSYEFFKLVLHKSFSYAWNMFGPTYMCLFKNAARADYKRIATHVDANVTGLIDIATCYSLKFMITSQNLGTKVKGLGITLTSMFDYKRVNTTNSYNYTSNTVLKKVDNDKDIIILTGTNLKNEIPVLNVRINSLVYNSISRKADMNTVTSHPKSWLTTKIEEYFPADIAYISNFFRGKTKVAAASTNVNQSVVLMGTSLLLREDITYFQLDHSQRSLLTSSSIIWDNLNYTSFSISVSGLLTKGLIDSLKASTCNVLSKRRNTLVALQWYSDHSIPDREYFKKIYNFSSHDYGAALLSDVIIPTKSPLNVHGYYVSADGFYKHYTPPISYTHSISGEENLPVRWEFKVLF